MKKRDYFNIPNMMGYFRILMLPVFMIFYLRVDHIFDRNYFIAFAALLLSILSDLFDGKIARKFNMVTDFGKILDPIADKLTQGVLAITIAIKYPLLWIFLGIFIIKEFYQLLMNYLIIKKKDVVLGAKWFGKFSTGGIDMTFFALLVAPNMPGHVVQILIWMLILVLTYSFICYFAYFEDVLHENFPWKKQTVMHIIVGIIFIIIHLAIIAYYTLHFYGMV